MTVEIEIGEAPLFLEPRSVPGCGAVARFEGIVRGSENGSPIAALEYEAYQPMAEKVMREILCELGEQHPFALARVRHRFGVVPVGDAAIVLEIHSPHRGEAFAVLSKFMDRLKQDVPIWKVRAIPLERTQHESPAVGRPDPPRAVGAVGIEELWALIDAVVQPLPPERRAVEHASGRRVCEDVCARNDFPAFDHSAMDGYAFAEAEPGKCRIVCTVAAGDSPSHELCPGEAVRILTGAPIPSGTFAIARQEDCVTDAGFVTPEVPLSDGAHIRRRAAVARAGEPLLAAGEALLPGAVALLVSCGVSDVPVFPLPRVTHLSTGSELLEPGSAPRDGKIPDSNGPMMTALLAACGLSVQRRRLADDPLALAECVRAFEGDLLLISGGSGPGDRDNTAAALESGGFVIHTRRVNSRPGRPLLFATRRSQVAFGLPGNPLSHWVCHHVFVRRALNRLEGRPPLEFVETACPSWPDAPTGGGSVWTPASVQIAGGLAVATPLPWLHSGDLSPLSSANALLLDAPDPSTQRIRTLLL